VSGEQGTGAKGSVESRVPEPHLHSNGGISAGNNCTSSWDINHAREVAAQYSRDTQDGPVLLPGIERNQSSKDFRTRMKGTQDRKMTAFRRKKRQRCKIKNKEGS